MMRLAVWIKFIIVGPIVMLIYYEFFLDQLVNFVDLLMQLWICVFF